jgi:RNA polymerase sigma-70 factor (ECF subfamily)
MFRILRNTFLTSRAGLAAQKTVYLEEEEGLPGDAQGMSTTETPETILLERMDEQTMQTAIGELPTALKEVLLLCEVEEMSYQEMSEALSIPMGTVMSRLSRARAALRKALSAKMREA